MTALLLLVALALAAPSSAPPPSTTWARARLSRTDQPALPDEARRLALTSLVAELLRAAPSGRLPPQAPERALALGLSLERHGDVLWLAEPARPDLHDPGEEEAAAGEDEAAAGEDEAAAGEEGAGAGEEGDGPIEVRAPETAPGGPPLRGDGLVGVRLGPLSAEVVLQAPHPAWDRHTGSIAGALFDQGHARAVMIATHERDVAPDVDPADQERGPLQALTAAVPLALPDALVVQLHGFGKRRSEADAVLSAGMARSGGELQRHASQALAVALGSSSSAPDPAAPPAVARVDGPAQVPLLAARDNVQGWLLADRVRYLHLELSAPTRARLRREPAARQRLGQALVDVARRAPPPGGEAP